MRLEQLEAKERYDREIRRLGRKALKERRNEQWLKELIETGVAEKLYDGLTADQWETIGKSFARRARKEQKRADACFIFARAKRREVTNGKN